MSPRTVVLTVRVSEAKARQVRVAAEQLSATTSSVLDAAVALVLRSMAKGERPPVMPRHSAGQSPLDGQE